MGAALRRAGRLFSRVLRHSVADERGVSAVEFGIMAPALVFMMVATYDLGIGIYRRMQVQNATQVGAAYAAAHGFSPSGISNAMANATSLSDITATPAPAQFCGCPTGSSITVMDCSATCPDGTQAATYARISGQATYQTIIPYPSLPASFVLTAQSTVRMQ
jgi:Flp pilus assembly protein TadG